MLKKEYKLMLLTSLFLLVCFSSAQATDFQLYKNFKFGQKRSEILKIGGIYDCSEDSNSGSLCLDNHQFLDSVWELEFLFLGDKLAAINLITEFDQTKYFVISKSLAKKFSCVGLQQNDNFLDIVKLKKTVAETLDFQQKIKFFEQKGLENGYIKYFYLETSAILNKLPDSNSLPDLLQNTEADIREIDFEVYETDEGENAWCELTFRMPIMLKALIKKMPAKNEDF